MPNIALDWLAEHVEVTIVRAPVGGAGAQPLLNLPARHVDEHQRVRAAGVLKDMTIGTVLAPLPPRGLHIGVHHGHERLSLQVRQ